MTLAATRATPTTWWLTSEALAALEAEIERLEADVGSSRALAVGTHAGTDPARRLRDLHAVRAGASVDDASQHVAIGRRVTIEEADGAAETWALVLPGDGDPVHGWVSAGSPLGLALLGARPGDVVEVVAPAGPRRVCVRSVG
jgi:transcription elongation factor GreB